MYKPIPSKLRPNHKRSEYAKEEPSRRRVGRGVRMDEGGQGGRNPSISGKMEEKYIFNVGSGIRRSSSINGKSKGPTDRLIEEEYHTNTTKPASKGGEVAQDCL